MRFLYIALGFVVVMAVLAAVPTLLGLILDPLNMRRIRTYCSGLGLENVSITPYPNHYGIEAVKHGRRIYAKCSVSGKRSNGKDQRPRSVSVLKPLVLPQSRR
jgi:hypothetical protein